MSNVIAFLERLGRDPALNPQGEEFVAALKSASLDDQSQAALLSGDVGTLSELLGGRRKMLCSLFPADGDEKRDDEGEGDKEGDDDGGKKSPEKSPSIGLN